MQEMYLCSRSLPYIMRPLLQVMMQVIAMRGMTTLRAALKGAARIENADVHSCKHTCSHLNSLEGLFSGIKSPR